MSRRIGQALALAAGLVLSVCAGLPQARGQEPVSFAGRPLAEALDALRDRGLRIVYSSDLVRPEMIVAREPAAERPREVLAEILAPFGLAIRAAPGEVLLVVRADPTAGARIGGRVADATDGSPLEGVVVTAGGRRAVTGADGRFEIGGLPAGEHELVLRLPGFAETRTRAMAGGSGLAIALAPVPIPLREIVVSPSRYQILRDEPAPRQVLTREEVERIPHLADDTFRAVQRLPGATASDFNADFHVRGGGSDELLVVIDGLEVYEPFHMKDFQNLFSIVDSRAIGDVDFMSGGFPVEYGDRMSGVLDIRTARPTTTRAGAGVSFVNAHAATEGTFGEDQRGAWLLVGRRGYLDLVLDLIGEDDDFDPRWSDLVAKLTWRVGDGGEVSAHVLSAGDEVVFDETSERAEATYGNRYGWIGLRWSGGPWASRTTASVGSVERDRTGRDEETLSVRDERGFDVLGLRQEWEVAAGERHLLRAGFDVKRLSARYDYERSTMREPEEVVESVPLPEGVDRSPGAEGEVEVHRGLDGSTAAVWLADRVRLADPLVVEAGLRWDRQTFAANDDQVSPRVSVRLDIGRETTLRAGWGRFHQSQRINELQIEDGIGEFQPVQRAEHWLVGLERGGASASLRLEAYRKHVENPITRYENAFDPLELFGEGHGDRLRIDPETTTASGVEALLRGRSGGVRWWISYAVSRVEDELPGRELPRRWDQTHAIDYSVDWELGRWTLNASGVHHTGWPRTFVGLATDGDTPRPVVGSLYDDRFETYHRIDLRLTRRFRLGGGTAFFYAELLNLLNRENPCCLDGADVRTDPRGAPVLWLDEDGFLPRIPSFGFTWLWGDDPGRERAGR